MFHVLGVYDAALDPVNGILQPRDLADIGEYYVRAAVVSPVVNVMCVNIGEDDLEPLIYTAWPDALTENTTKVTQKVGHDEWQMEVPVIAKDEWLNRTTFDDIFRWGPKYGRRPPVFPLVSSAYFHQSDLPRLRDN